MTNLENELSTVNKSVDNIESLTQRIGDIPIKQPEENNQKNQPNTSNKPENNNENKGRLGFEDDKTQENNRKIITKQVQVYISVSSDIISAKMKILRDIKSQSMRIIHHYVNPLMKEDNKEESKDKNNSEVKKIET